MLIEPDSGYQHRSFPHASTKIMKITITCALQNPPGQSPYLLVLIPQNQLLQLEWRRNTAAVISSLFDVPVVLVGLIGRNWQVYGEAPAIHHAGNLHPELILWKDASFEV